MRSFFAILSAFILIGIDTNFRFTATALASPIPKNIDKPKGVAFCHARRGDDDACPQPFSRCAGVNCAEENTPVSTKGLDPPHAPNKHSDTPPSIEGDKVQDGMTTRDHHTIQFYNNVPQNIGVKGPISHPPEQVQATSWHHPEPSPSSIVAGPTKAVEKSTSLSSREIPEDKHPEILDMPLRGSVPAIPA